jgi:zinc protease
VTHGASDPTRAMRRPRPQSPRPYTFPRFERRRLDNGMELVIAPVHKLPIATMIVLVDAGATCGARGREGVAQLTASSMLEGTATSDGLQLTERFELLGASVDASADWDGAALRVTALLEHFPAAVRLVGEVIRAPAFPTREVERLKTERLAQLLQQRTEPRGLADDMFARFLYDSASRYALPEHGTTESISAMTRDDIARFYATRYTPASVTVVIVGDIGVDQAETLARQTFADWRGDAPPECRTVDTPARRTRAIHLVGKPESAQSELRIGNVGIPRNHPDYYATVVMNAILGGLFSSRINLNLREAHGYTYGAFSSMDWRRQCGPFVVSSAIQSEVTAQAAREAISEIERIRLAPVSESELSLATSYLDGVFPIRYETTDAIAGALAALVRYRLEDDYFDTYRQRVRDVTTDDVLRAAHEHLHPEALQLVVVGDAPALQHDLESLGFGPLTVYDTDGTTV